MPTWEVELSAGDLALLGISNPTDIEARLDELARQRLAEIAEGASFYPEVAKPIRRARLKLVVESGRE